MPELHPVRLHAAAPDLVGPQRLAWQTDAACVNVGLDAFYPASENSQAYRTQAAEAIRICGLCRVQAECLAYALETDDRFGVLGGTTPAQRKAMRGTA